MKHLRSVAYIASIIIYLTISALIILISARVGVHYGAVAQFPFIIGAFVWGFNCIRLVKWMAE